MRIVSVEEPVPLPEFQFAVQPMLVEVDDLVRASLARARFGVSGKGTSVAVLDTGLRASHRDFSGRVLEGANFTADYDGDSRKTRDGNGHGTNVSGVLAANGVHVGISPAASVVPVKVVQNIGFSPFENVERALIWLLEHRQRLGLSCICASIGDGENHQSPDDFSDNKVLELFSELRDHRIPSVVAAGNFFYKHGSTPGMVFPAVAPEIVSVGAVYDDDLGEVSYRDGAVAFKTAADVITPFSQRLPVEDESPLGTTIFAPGAPVVSSGIASDTSSSKQNGTSQAAPVVAGVILLMQELARRTSGELPTVDLVVDCLRGGGVEIIDGDNENDNVTNTQAAFVRIDAPGALRRLQRRLV